MWIHYDGYGNEYFYPYTYTNGADYLPFKNYSAYNYFATLPYHAPLLNNVTYGSLNTKAAYTINGGMIDYGMDNNIYSFLVSVGTYYRAQADILPTCRVHANIFKQIALTIGPWIEIKFSNFIEEICIKNETCTSSENAYAYVTLKYIITNIGLSDSYAVENFIFKATYGSSYSYEIRSISVTKNLTSLSYKNISDSAYNISFEINIGSIPALSNTSVSITFLSYKALSYNGEIMTIHYLAKMTSSLTAYYSALLFSDSIVTGKVTQDSTAINNANYGSFYYIRVSSGHHELSAVAAISILMSIFMIAIWVLIIKKYKSEQVFGNHNSEPYTTGTDQYKKNITIESAWRKPQANLNGSSNGFEIKRLEQDSIKVGLGPNIGEGSPGQRGAISIPNSPPKARENFGGFREAVLGEGSLGGIGYGMLKADIKNNIENSAVRSARQEGLSIPMRSGLISQNEPEIKGNINVPRFGPVDPEIAEDLARKVKISAPPEIRDASLGKNPPAKLGIVEAPQLPIFARSPTDFSAKSQEKQGFSSMYDAEDLQPSFGRPQGFGENIMEKPKLPFANSQLRSSSEVMASEGAALNQVSIPPIQAGGINLENPNSKGSFQPISASFGDDSGDIEILVDEKK